ncbi:helix-turn-helix domain-containing protein [Agreia sp. Leaf283]|uniref:helix-turn-helix domain-containing protein n=1 Tax=Agreia sp. Leaf283 TaxID=1736321 RepID=UPI0009E9D256|nr:helix-turn-helix domain-containing protein [Agreia sp. Leaf283]
MNQQRPRKPTNIAPPPRTDASSTSRRERYGDPYLVSQDEAGHLLSISRTTVWRLIRDGELQLVRIGSRKYVSTASIQEFVTRHSTGHATK